MTGSNLPRWDLNPIYTGYDSASYGKDISRVETLCSDLIKKLENHSPEANWLSERIEEYNGLRDTFETLFSYVYTRYSTDTTDKATTKEYSRMQNLELKTKRISALLKSILGRLSGELNDLLKDEKLKKYSHFLKEQAFLATRQMPLQQEDLAADLQIAGGDAWGKLQATLSSNLSMEWDQGNSKTVTELRALAFDSDRKIREKAFNKEIEAWKQAAIPLAAALNGVKGFSHTVNTRRGWSSTLEKSTFQARISEKTLTTLIKVMEKNLPLFRKYLSIKAKALKLDKLAFYDLFAPIEKGEEKWSWDRTRDFIIKQFRTFSQDMADFARRAFEENWIDAESRPGKVGGAYCISFPDRQMCRILCNFDGSFSAVKTVAHELGHAYHHHILKEEPHIFRDYPMTLAETASIFAENIVFNAALKEAPPKEKLALLEEDLQSSTQVIVDILSRFYFEQDVMKERAKGELSPQEFCSLMTKAQKATYGDALSSEDLHPYMWAVKGHYYQSDLAFYNFPYAFGQLFGMGLYSRFNKEGPSFSEVYKDILLGTGRMNAEELTKNAGFNIQEESFWQSGIDLMAAQVDDLEKLIGERES